MSLSLAVVVEMGCMKVVEWAVAGTVEEEADVVAVVPTDIGCSCSAPDKVEVVATGGGDNIVDILGPSVTASFSFPPTPIEIEAGTAKGTGDNPAPEPLAVASAAEAAEEADWQKAEKAEVLYPVARSVQAGDMSGMMEHSQARCKIKKNIISICLWK